MKIYCRVIFKSGWSCFQINFGNLFLIFIFHSTWHGFCYFFHHLVLLLLLCADEQGRSSSFELEDLLLSLEGLYSFPGRPVVGLPYSSCALVFDLPVLFCLMLLFYIFFLFFFILQVFLSLVIVALFHPDKLRVYYLLTWIQELRGLGELLDLNLVELLPLFHLLHHQISAISTSTLFWSVKCKPCTIMFLTNSC